MYKSGEECKADAEISMHGFGKRSARGEVGGSSLGDGEGVPALGRMDGTGRGVASGGRGGR